MPSRFWPRRVGDCHGDDRAVVRLGRAFGGARLVVRLIDKRVKLPKVREAAEARDVSAALEALAATAINRPTSA